MPGCADDPRRDVEVVGVVLDDQHACHQRLAVRLSRAVSLGGNYQPVIHPAFNRDRGPIHIFTARAHVAF